MQCLHGLRWKKPNIFLLSYIIVALFCPASLKRSNFYKAQEKKRALIGQLSSALWLVKYLKRVTEMLHPLPYLEYQLLWRWRQQYYSENKSYFFAYTFVRCYANLPTQWRRFVGACFNEAFKEGVDES